MASEDTPPPPYEEREPLEELSTHTNSQAEGLIAEYSKRVNEIDERLKELGYGLYGSPINCCDYLMSFEASLKYRDSTKVDAPEYAQKLGKLVSQYTKTKEVLDSKVQELMGKDIPIDDVTDFIFKEESCGEVSKHNIRYYYDMHRVALHKFVDFMENSEPVDAKKIFEEKNRLVEEKVRLLLKRSRLQLLEFEGILSDS